MLKLGDDGRLSLDDPVSRWIPEFARMAAHARHAAADYSPVAEPQRGPSRRQPVGRSAVERHRRDDGRLARQGHSILHTPGTRSEYSNYAFGLLGRVVTKADDTEAKQIAAVNFFLDAPSAQRQEEIRALQNEVGECTDTGPVIRRTGCGASST